MSAKKSAFKVPLPGVPIDHGGTVGGWGGVAEEAEGCVPSQRSPSARTVRIREMLMNQVSHAAIRVDGGADKEGG